VWALMLNIPIIGWFLAIFEVHIGPYYWNHKAYSTVFGVSPQIIQMVFWILWGANKCSLPTWIIKLILHFFLVYPKNMN
jgi:hypothetical protein